MHTTFWPHRAVAAAMIAVASATATIAGAAESGCDITGNWREAGKPFQAEVIVDEPVLPEGHIRSFEQDLTGLRSQCDLEIEYLPSLDLDPDHPGDAIERRFQAFRGLAVDGKPVALNWKETAKSPLKYTARCHLGQPPEGQTVHLTLTWHDTRPPRTRLLGRDLLGRRLEVSGPCAGGAKGRVAGCPRDSLLGGTGFL